MILKQSLFKKEHKNQSQILHSCTGSILDIFV